MPMVDPYVRAAVVEKGWRPGSSLENRVALMLSNRARRARQQAKDAA